MNNDKSFAILGNFTDVNVLFHAAEKVRDSGYHDFDIFTPYPVHGLDKAMGVKRTILPYISFFGGISGLASAVLLMWWTGADNYKLNIGGKPFFAVEFGMPVMFELTILLTALFTFVGMWGLCKLPRWYHELQHDEGFQRACDDQFVVAIFSTDKRFSADTTKKLLSDIGASDIRLVESGAI